ncbi:hypothetical protein Celaphus_00019240, partial [Cervus elaphus hippelaphus]
LKLEERRKELLQKLEETTKLTTGPGGAAAAAPGHPAPLAEAPKSVTSLSSRSSLSSLSPPGSPLVLEGAFPMSPHDGALHQFSADFEDCELSGHFADISLGEHQLLLDPDPGGAPPSLLDENKELGECAQEPLYEGPADVEKSLPKRRGIHLLGEKTACVSAAVSDESVAGDSGVYEAFVKQPSEVEDVPYNEEDAAVMETAQVQIGLRYDAKRSSFMVVVAQLRNLHAFLIPHSSKVYFRVALLPSSSDVSCLFRTKVHPAAESLLFNDVFRVAVSQTALQQKTLRVDLCSVGKPRKEECLAGTQISLADLPFSNEIFTLWYNLLPSKQIPCKKNEEETEDSDAVTALLARTSAELLAVEQELAQEEEPGQEGEHRGPDGDWLAMLREASDEVVAEEGAEVKLAEGSRCVEDVSSRPRVPEMDEDTSGKESSCADDLGSQPPTGTPALVDKETNTDEAGGASVAVRPKDRSSLSARQHTLVRSSVIVRSQTFSPGERSQYVCRLNRSDSDSSTLAKKSLFVRNSTERRSLRVKRVCSPSAASRGPDHPESGVSDAEPQGLGASVLRAPGLWDEATVIVETQTSCLFRRRMC